MQPRLEPEASRGRGGLQGVLLVFVLPGSDFEFPASGLTIVRSS